jgi:hypothetical protein
MSRAETSGAKARSSSLPDNAALKRRSSTVVQSFAGVVASFVGAPVEERPFMAASALSLIWASAPVALTNGMRGNSRRRLAA